MGGSGGARGGAAHPRSCAVHGPDDSRVGQRTGPAACTGSGARQAAGSAESMDGGRMSGHTERRPIPGAPGYSVAEDGRVFSESHNWRGYGTRELAQDLNSHGYPRVRITVGGRRKVLLVHKAVAAAFLPPRPSKRHELRHKNGTPTDNRAANLAWGTRAENAADRDRHGRTSRGLAHSHAIRRGRADALTDAEIATVMDLRQRGLPQRSIASAVGRSQSAVGAVIRREEVSHG